MLDIKFIRDNVKLVEKNSLTRNVTIDSKKLIKLDEEVRTLQTEIDQLRASRNTGSKTKPTPDQIKAMKKVGDQIRELEAVIAEKEVALKALLIAIPNMNHPSTPIGKDDSGNKI